MAHAKQQLTDFVIGKAFDPVLKARPHGMSDADRRVLQHVQQATMSEIDRYRNYASAQDVVVNFKRDLSSPAAKKIHAELRRLNLPTIEDARDEFERLAEKLGVS